MLDLPPPQVECVAAAIYHEARGEGDIGQRAIAHVILNRAKKRGMTPCQIIRQPGQFHFKMRGSYSGGDWYKAYRIASNPGADPTYGAHFFHNKSVNPRWKLKRTVTIKNHIFYK